MKLQARVGGGAGSGETGPKLTLLRNRLLNRESASADSSRGFNLAKSLEVVNISRKRIAKLASTLEQYQRALVTKLGLSSARE